VEPVFPESFLPPLALGPLSVNRVCVAPNVTWSFFFCRPRPRDSSFALRSVAFLSSLFPSCANLHSELFAVAVHAPRLEFRQSG